MKGTIRYVGQTRSARDVAFVSEPSASEPRPAHLHSMRKMLRGCLRWCRQAPLSSSRTAWTAQDRDSEFGLFLVSFVFDDHPRGRQDEPRAAFRTVFRADAAAVQLDEMLDDGEPQPVPPGSRARDLSTR